MRGLWTPDLLCWVRGLLLRETLKKGVFRGEDQSWDAQWVWAGGTGILGLVDLKAE